MSTGHSSEVTDLTSGFDAAVAVDGAVGEDKEFSLEEFVVESVLGLRAEFEQCFAAAASTEVIPDNDSIVLEVTAPWEVSGFDTGYMVVCDDPRMASVSATQRFRIPLSTSRPIDELLSSIHAAFRPLEEAEYWLELDVRFHLDVESPESRSLHSWVLPETTVEQVRRGLALFAADRWIVMDNEVAGSFIGGHHRERPDGLEVSVLVTAQIAMVPLEDNGECPADLLLEVPVSAAVLDEIIALACDGELLDDAVEAVTGQRQLPM